MNSFSGLGPSDPSGDDGVQFDPFGVFAFFAVLILVGAVGFGLYGRTGSGSLGVDIDNLLWQDQNAVKLSRGLADHYGPVVVSDAPRAAVATPEPDQLWPELNPRIAGDMRVGAKLRIVDPAGKGVVARSAPLKHETAANWADGTMVVYDGEQGEADGLRWVKVKTPDGTTGWAPAQHLAPSY
jgi:hypothetical protein